MSCKRKGHAFLCGHLLGIALTVGVILWITKTKKGKAVSKKARRIAGEVEDIVKDELGM